MCCLPTTLEMKPRYHSEPLCTVPFFQCTLAGYKTSEARNTMLLISYKWNNQFPSQDHPAVYLDDFERHYLVVPQFPEHL